MSEELALEVVLIPLITLALTALYDRYRESKERKRMFKTLFDELCNTEKRADANTTTIEEETLRLRQTADLKIRTLMPLSTLGWDLIRSSGITASLGPDTLAHLYAAYDQVDIHNKLVALRERYIASSVPTIIQPMYVEDYNHRISQALSSVKTEIEYVKPEIKKKADC